MQVISHPNIVMSTTKATQYTYPIARMRRAVPLAARVRRALRVQRAPQTVRIDVHRLHAADKQRQYVTARGGDRRHRPGQRLDAFVPVEARGVGYRVPVLVRAARDRGVGG